MSNISDWVTAVAAIVSASGIWFVWRQANFLGEQTKLSAKQAELLTNQMKENYEWNCRKTTQEILYGLSTGRFTELRKKLLFDFNFDPVVDNRISYEEVIKSLPKEKVIDFNFTLMQALNLLEAVCVAIRHGIADEDICYDYLGKVITSYYNFSEPMIRRRRESMKFARAAGSLEYYANRWEKRLNEERSAMLVRPKPPIH